MGIMRKQSFTFNIILWERYMKNIFISYGVLNFLLFLFLPKSVSYSCSSDIRFLHSIQVLILTLNAILNFVQVSKKKSLTWLIDLWSVLKVFVLFFHEYKEAL